MTTIKNVAQVSGVSIATVSNALNGKSNVGEETRKKIIEAANSLNYIPNFNAKMLKGKKSKIIGIFIPNIKGKFYFTLIQAIYSLCKIKGYSLQVNISDRDDSKTIIANIMSSNIDGAIVLNELLKDEDIYTMDDKSIPIVFLDRKICTKNVSSIVINNEQSMLKAVDYLNHLKHKKIAFMRGTDNYDDVTRFDGFLKAMERYSIEVDYNWVLRGYFEQSVAYNSLRDAMMKNYDYPDAIICENDEMALGCMNALNDLDVRVPEDISIIGFDDIDISRNCTPALTTLHSPIVEMGKNAVEEILRLVNKSEDGIIKVIDANLKIRNSCSYRG